MNDLWSDRVNKSTEQEWVDGSYCDKLYKDTRTLRAELVKATLPMRKLCKGCTYAPYDSNFGRCIVCFSTTKYEAKRDEPIVRWLRVDNNVAYKTEFAAADGGNNFKHIKLVEER